MRRSRPRWLMGAVVILLGGTSPAAAPRVAAASPAWLVQAYGELPPFFEANLGQTDTAVRFLCRDRGYTLFLTSDEAVWSLHGAARAADVIRLRFAPDGGRRPRLVGVDPQAGRVNYFRGQESHTGIPTFGQVRVEGAYPGVDAIFRANRRQLDVDLVIAPGADPRRLRLAFQGAQKITLGASGELVLHTAHGDLLQPAPALYQEIAGRRRRVEGHYVLPAAPSGGACGASCQVGFAVGSYDPTRPLVIDPPLVYSTFLGGSKDDGGSGIAVDAAGNAYIVGFTRSPTFPGYSGTVPPGGVMPPSHVFVTKINPIGTAIVYSTLLIGSGGFVGEQGRAIAVDGAGAAYLTGSTDSTTFPGVSGSSIQPAFGGLLDAFVTKIDPTGAAIVYSTFLGGSSIDFGNGIAVDASGNAYVTGSTTSPTFPGVSGTSIQPALGGFSDAFVTKINAAGTAIVYSTYLGGSAPDSGNGIAVDGPGDAFVTGSTDSPTFPGVTGSSIKPTNAGGDAFVTMLNPAGTAIAYSTFLGGSAADAGNAIAIDGAGNAYVTGVTSSSTFTGVNGSSIQPAHGGGVFDGFVTKINPSGTAVVYSTFLGGNGPDAGQGIAVDLAGNAWVTGYTVSDTFPGVNSSSLQPTRGGSEDAFTTMIDAGGAAIGYSTFLGGSNIDIGSGIAVDAAGSAYITGLTDSSTFPGVSAASIQPANAGGADAFVLKLGRSAPGIPALAPGSLVLLALLLAGCGLAAVKGLQRAKPR